MVSIRSGMNTPWLGLGKDQVWVKITSSFVVMVTMRNTRFGDDHVDGLKETNTNFHLDRRQTAVSCPTQHFVDPSIHPDILPVRFLWLYII